MISRVISTLIAIPTKDELPMLKEAEKRVSVLTDQATDAGADALLVRGARRFCALGPWCGRGARAACAPCHE